MNLPPPLNWLYKGWMAFSHVLGMVMSKIILTILWLVAFSIYAIVLKVIMLFTSKKPKESYWLDAPPDYPDSMRYQF
ncbi:MAG: SxtJ family membrane protein [Candidatus Peregrinibacteria bacterium]|nr:SxtJ family membrane protein [Candidatus Peregrinibacteria bacterium]